MWIITIPHSPIYSLPLSTTPSTTTPLHTTASLTRHSNSVYEQKTKQDVVKFIHAACFSPVPQTLVQAINASFFSSWHDLTASLITKHFPKCEATTLGHLDQTRKNIRSTRVHPQVSIPQQLACSFDSIASPMRTNIVLVDTFMPSKIIYSDLTGMFPVKSTRGNQYVFLLYDYDSNTFHVRSLCSRKDTAIVAAYDSIHVHLCSRGLAPELQLLDNETSTALQQSMQKNSVDFQLVPPHNHQQNTADRSIRTFKEHVIADICSTHPAFPLKQWDTLLEQAAITLNLLWPPRINPKLSGYSLLEGEFNFDRTPLVPPGTRVVIHEKPAQRASWAPYGIHGWYIGPSLLHYRCYRCYIPSTNFIRDSCTVAFSPINFPIFRTSSADAATSADLDLIIALKNPAPASPFDISNPSLCALHHLADIFQTAAPKLTLPPVLSPTVPLPLSHSILLRKNTQPPQPPSVAPRVVELASTPPLPVSPTPPLPLLAIQQPRVGPTLIPTSQPI